MRYKLLIFFVLIFGNELSAQYQTNIFSESIKSLQVGVKDQKYFLPIIELKGADVIKISFDEMSHESHSYSYTVLQCNSDWTLSSLNSTEYLEGYTTADITDFALSQNTGFLYTHYNFYLPNDYMSFKKSGNYVVLVYEDNKKDQPVFQACFSVVEPKVTIDANVRGNTDTELNGRLQQLDFDLMLNGYAVKDPASELKVVVRQNNRTDNEVRNILPTYYAANKLSYINNKSLIFEGGNDFHVFDISSAYAAGRGVDKIVSERNVYTVFLTPDKIQTTKMYMPNPDANGKFLINYQEQFDDSDIEADYMWVNFQLMVEKPFFDGLLYLGGEFNYNQLNGKTLMNYDAQNQVYYKSVLLKQGGYNYQYRFVPKGQTSAVVGKVDGSYWQTGNEYTIYIYHRPWGERYDKLIGVKQL